eukprot:TRINITY_DN2256_c0_g3_i1.p1 TRINITY_DN2256_c0_g3~~TRINITY_DN2256_c0_g3_i1.p1  ORF type:complete len:1398 (+),score=544.34 TRINITY_DN2256_c0_g3_i1:123-4316(+)
MASKKAKNDEDDMPPLCSSSEEDEMPPLCSSSDSESSEEDKKPKIAVKHAAKPQQNLKSSSEIKKGFPFQPPAPSSTLSIQTNAPSSPFKANLVPVSTSSAVKASNATPSTTLNANLNNNDSVGKKNNVATSKPAEESKKEEDKLNGKAEEKASDSNASVKNNNNRSISIPISTVSKANGHVYNDNSKELFREDKLLTKVSMPELILTSSSDDDTYSDLNSSMGVSSEEESRLPELLNSENSEEDMPDLASSSSEDFEMYTKSSKKNRNDSDGDVPPLAEDSSDEEYKPKKQKAKTKSRAPPANDDDDGPPPLISSSDEEMVDDDEPPPLVSSSDDDKHKKVKTSKVEPKKVEKLVSKGNATGSVKQSQPPAPKAVKTSIPQTTKSAPPKVEHEEDDGPPPLVSSSDEEIQVKKQEKKVEKKEEPKRAEKKEVPKKEEVNITKLVEKVVEKMLDTPKKASVQEDDEGPPPLLSSSEDEEEKDTVSATATHTTSSESSILPSQNPPIKTQEVEKLEVIPAKIEDSIHSVAPEIAKTLPPQIDADAVARDSEDDEPPPLLSSSSEEEAPKGKVEKLKTEDEQVKNAREEKDDEPPPLLSSSEEEGDRPPPLLSSSEEEDDDGPIPHIPQDDDEDYSGMPRLISSSSESEGTFVSKKEKEKEKEKEETKQAKQLSAFLEDMLDEELIEMDLQSIAPAASYQMQLQIEKSKQASLKEEENTKQGEMYKQTANDLIAKGKYTLAIKYYTKAIESSPNNPIYWANRSAAHFKDTNYGLAISDATRAIELDEGYTKAHYRRGTALVEVGRFKEAKEDFKIVLAENPNVKEAAVKLRHCEEVIRKTTFGKAISSEKESALRKQTISKFVFKPVTWLEDEFPKLSILASRVIAKDIMDDFEGAKMFLDSIPQVFLQNIVPWLRWDVFERYRMLVYRTNPNPNSSLTVANKYQLLKSEEDYYRKLFATNRNHNALKDPHLLLINVHKNMDLFFLELDEEIDTIPKLCTAAVSSRTKFLMSVDGAVPNLNYDCTVVDQPTFFHNFNVFTEGQLVHLDWNNVFAAGGSILACLMPTPPSINLSEYYHVQAYKSSDIDLFIYGLTPKEANQKLEQIFDEICKAYGSQVMAVRTRHAITLVTEFPRRNIQIILRLYSSPAEILMGFDVDSCSVGFDGVKVWMNPRCARALKYQTNIVDMTRRSPSYENRLIKYSKRGFSISVPGFEPNRPQINWIDWKNNGLSKLIRVDRAQKVRPYSTSTSTSRDSWTRDKIEITKGESEHVGDYEHIHIPYGPQWSMNEVRHYLGEQVNGHADDYYYRLHVCRPPRAEGVAVVVFGSMKNVLDNPISTNEVETNVFEEGRSVAVLRQITKENMWMTENPGRQTNNNLLTGSFHPINEAEEEWFKGVYLQ